MPYTEQLAGGDGLVAVRFKANKVEQRPIGFFGPGRREFTFVFWATEKGDKYRPKHYLKSAAERKTEAYRFPERIYDYE